MSLLTEKIFRATDEIANVNSNLSLKCPNKINQAFTHSYNISDNSPNNILENISNNMSDKISEKIIYHISDEMSDKISAKNPDQTSDQITNQISEKIADQTFNNSTDEASNKKDKTSDKIVELTSDKISDQLSDQSSDQSSDNNSGHTSEQMSDKISEETSDQLFDEMTDQLSCQKSTKTCDKKIADQLSDNTINRQNIIIGNRSMYKIDEKRVIGRGAFSIVYSGMDINNNEKVAIKRIMLSKLTNNEISVVDREVRTVTKLINMSNPCKNIVSYYDVIKNNSCVYIVMEICSDGTFSSLLIKPLKERYSKYYFKQMMNALKTLHDMNIVHKDVKPDNILIFNDYKTLKLCDFGFSHEFTEINTNDIMCGSPIYMAPEILRHKKNISLKNTPIKTSSTDVIKSDYKTNSDTWSVGLILYEMVYGYHPYRGTKDIKSLRHASENSVKVLEMPWIDLNSDGFQLLKSMLDPNNMSRITINNIMRSSWMTIEEPYQIEKIILSDLFHNSHIQFISKSLPKSCEYIDIMKQSKNKKPETNYLSVSDKGSKFTKKNISNDDKQKINKSLTEKIINSGTFDNIIKKHNQQILTLSQNENKSETKTSNSSVTIIIDNTSDSLLLDDIYKTD